MRAYVTAVSFTLLACGGPGEPAPDAGDSLCRSQEACSDGVFCNGVERCAPGAPNANADGCLPGNAPCFATQRCDEAARACETACDRDPDADGDGRAAASCGGDDCDDADPARYPGNLEVCDLAGHDEDCDPSTVGALDADADGVIAAECCNGSSDGGERCGADCDDSAYGRQPGFPELCDGVDNDCDGTVDEDPREAPWYADADGDGFGNASDSIVSCAPVAGRVLADNDCDDGDPAIRPGAIERCEGTDDDCDGEVDEGACGTDTRLSVAAVFTLNGVEPDADVCAWAGVGSVRFAFDRGDGSIAFETEVSCDAGAFDTRPATPLGRGTFTFRVIALDPEGGPIGQVSELLVTALPPLVHLGLPPVDIDVGATVCSRDAQCDDGNFCNGAERCALGVGRCSAALAPREDGELCDADGSPTTTDICVAGACTLARCGDGFLTRENEECDDGNLVALDGCDESCRADDRCLAWFAADSTGGSRFRSIRATRAGQLFGSASAGVPAIAGPDGTLVPHGRNPIASCGAQLVAAHHDDDALHVLSHRYQTVSSGGVFRVPLPSPLSVACPPDGSFAYVLSRDPGGEALVQVHSFALPLGPGSVPVASVSIDLDPDDDTLGLEHAWLRRWPGQDSLLVAAVWQGAPNDAARVGYDASGLLTVAEGPTRIRLQTSSNTFAIRPDGARFIQLIPGSASSFEAHVWNTSGTLATAERVSLGNDDFLDGQSFLHFAPDGRFVTDGRVGRMDTNVFEQLGSFTAELGATHLYDGALIVSWGSTLRTYDSPTSSAGALTTLDVASGGLPVLTPEPAIHRCAP